MLPHVSCPPVAHLESLVLGLLSQAELSRLEPHVAGCTHCLATVRGLSQVDTLIEAMRQGACSVVEPQADVDEGLIANLRQLRSSSREDDEPGAHGLLERLEPPHDDTELGRLGAYRILQECGAGGMSVVFRAEDTKLGRQVALKLLRPELCRRTTARRRFLREARAAAAVRHDHIVTVYQVGEEAGLLFLAMELLQGETLEARLRRDGVLPLTEVVRLGREVAAGLAAAHAAGLIHRDIKPANLWLEAGTGRVKILDFGLARVLDDVRVTQHGAIVGTPAYMAPEQARSGDCDGRADLFSLGCVLYRACTGRPAFDGQDITTLLLNVALDSPPPPTHHNRAVPPALDQLILQLLCKNPAGRPASAQEVGERLTARAEDSLRARGRGRCHVALAVLAVGLLCLAGLHQFGDSRPPAAVAELVPLRSWSIPPEERAALGEGDFPGLVGVLGESRLRVWGALNAVAFHAEGRALVGASDGTLYRWDSATGRRLHVQSGAFVTPDDKYVIDGVTEAVHDARTGQLVLRIGTFGTLHHGPAYSARRARLAALGEGNRVRLWNLQTRQELHTLPGHRQRVQSVAFRPDGDQLASVDEGGVLKVWDATSGKEVQSLQTPTGFRASLAYRPDGRMLALANYMEGTLVLWDATSWRPLRTLQLGRNPTRVVFRPDGRQLATTGGGAGSLVEVWHPDTGERLHTLGADESQVYGLDYSPDGRHLVTAGALGVVRVWETATGKEVQPTRGHRGPVKTLALTQDARQLLSAGHDGTLRLWDLATAQGIESRAGKWNGVLGSVAVASRIALRDGRGQVRVHEPLARARLPGPEVWRVPRTSGAAIALSPDGKRLATSPTHSPVVWDIDTGRELCVLTEPGAEIRALSFRPDGRQLAVAHRDGVVRLWQLDSARLTHTLRLPGEVPTTLAYCRDDKRLACGGATNRITIWDSDTGQELSVCRGQFQEVNHLAFRSDSARLAAATHSGLLAVWDAATGQPLREWTLPGSIHCVLFAPDGRHVFAGTANGTVLVFRTQPE